jgi:micrococcal nuclease
MKIWRLLMVLLFGLTASVGCGRSDQWVTVRDAIDGDTIRLEDGRMVRYLAIDAPEINHRTGHADPWGDLSLRANRALVKGRRVRLVSGSPVKDDYGRILAYVYRTDGRLINRMLMLQGLGYYYPFNPRESGTIASTMLHAQRDAMSRGVGLWTDRKAYLTGPYDGNRRSMRFHEPGCSMGKQIHPENRVRFETRWEAHWEGFMPAGCCLASPVKKELKRR